MRLPRPHISMKLRLTVLLRQYGEIDPEECGDPQQFLERAEKHGSLGYYVNWLKILLAQALKCDVRDLRLDHDPALENRAVMLKNHRVYPVQKVNRQDYDQIVRFIPDANDPDHLRYMPRPDHDIKTNVRGEGAQFADNVIAKRERRRRKKQARKKPFRKIPQRKNPWPKRRLR